MSPTQSDHPSEFINRISWIVDAHLLIWRNLSFLPLLDAFEDFQNLCFDESGMINAEEPALE